MSFSTLGLSDSIVQAVQRLGYTQPTPIQEQTIPLVLAGKNVIAAAQTGTGKTASFVLPILQQLTHAQTQGGDSSDVLRGKRVQALIVVPTRELAVQVNHSIQSCLEHCEAQLALTSMAIFGGVDTQAQKDKLLTGVNIVVATPGRLLDLVHQRAIQFDQLSVLVLDEADRMLDMGFIGDINKIVDRLPEVRQNLLFSATLSKEVRQLAKTTLNHPVEVSVTPHTKAASTIEQWLITVDKDRKSALLSHLIVEHNWQQALIFIRTKHGAAKLVSQLEKRGISAETIHSGRSQAMRAKVLEDFKSGELSLLVATDIAARGLDIEQLDRVINYDLPDDADDYVHRIGRTGRAGETGEAVSLISKDDFKRLCAVERRLGHIIERRDIEAFTPNKTVPISILNFKPRAKPSSASSRSGEAAGNNAAKKQRTIAKTKTFTDKNVAPKRESQSAPVWSKQAKKEHVSSRKKPIDEKPVSTLSSPKASDDKTAEPQDAKKTISSKPASVWAKSVKPWGKRDK